MLAGARGHAAVTFPAPRQSLDKALKIGDGCPVGPEGAESNGQACFWFSVFFYTLPFLTPPDSALCRPFLSEWLQSWLHRLRWYSPVARARRRDVPQILVQGHDQGRAPGQKLYRSRHYCRVVVPEAGRHDYRPHAEACASGSHAQEGPAGSQACHPVQLWQDRQAHAL